MHEILYRTPLLTTLLLEDGKNFKMAPKTETDHIRTFTHAYNFFYIYVETLARAFALPFHRKGSKLI